VLAVRLIVARREVDYVGRGATRLAEGVRLLMIKTDGTFMVWPDRTGAGGQKVKPLNSGVPPLSDCWCGAAWAAR
jgi:RecB family endonuclease NucS